jgi:predicted esterase
VRSYAVYLPSSYDGERPHPALVLLDARQGAMEPLEAFRPAAERFGWVLLSSWDSFSDGDAWPSVEAARAMHRDALARYRLDPRRVAIGGFSGTARLATWLALTEPQAWYAVVAAGAGFSETVKPAAELPFGWFATVGDRDFNSREVLAVERELVRFGAPHRVETFAAGHRWPPEALGHEALGWLELFAMRRQLRPADEPLAAELWQALLERAAAAESAANWLAAERLYRAAVADFAGLRDTAAAAAALARLEGSRELRAAARDDERLAQREQELVAAARQALGGIDPRRVTARQLHGRLGVDRLWKVARSEDPAEAAMGWRVLTALGGQLGSYLPTAAEARGDRELAELYRATAALLREGAPQG